MRAIDIVAAEKNAEKTTNGTSLVVIRNQLERANEDYLATLNLCETKRRSSYVHPDAYSHGEDFGNQVNLNRQTKNTTEMPLSLPLFNTR